MPKQTLVTADVHFNHLVIGYEDEQHRRSYVLLDAERKLVEEFAPTTDGETEVPADIASAMKMARRRHEASEAGAVLSSFES